MPGPQAVVVTLPAEIDAGNCGLVQAALARRPKVVVADGTGTRFCDCAAITTLITVHHQAATAGAQLRVAVTSADHVLLVNPSLSDAQAGGSHQPRPPPAAGF